MACMAEATVTLHTAIIEALKASEARPLQLLRSLAATGFPDSEIKEAVSNMLSQGELQLTSHRFLRLSSTTSF